MRPELNNPLCFDSTASLVNEDRGHESFVSRISIGFPVTRCDWTNLEHSAAVPVHASDPGQTECLVQTLRWAVLEHSRQNVGNWGHLMTFSYRVGLWIAAAVCATEKGQLCE